MKKYETPEIKLLLLQTEKDFLLSEEVGDAYQDDFYNDDFGFKF